MLSAVTDAEEQQPQQQQQEQQQTTEIVPPSPLKKAAMVVEEESSPVEEMFTPEEPVSVVATELTTTTTTTAAAAVATAAPTPSPSANTENPTNNAGDNESDYGEDVEMGDEEFMKQEELALSQSQSDAQSSTTAKPRKPMQHIPGFNQTQFGSPLTSTTGISQSISQVAPVAMEIDMGDSGQFLSLLKMFYQNLFPFKEYFAWLSYGGVQKNYFANREFSFTLPSDAYIRFQSFKDTDELKKEVVRLCPVKIDIGAVYNIKPKDKKLVRPGAFQPMEKELVFDIDMTDYDEIRSCCSGGDICLKCWDFMTISIKVVDRALREDFGYKHLLWVYSGRRGVHCWVCDASARKLTSEERKAVVSYLEVVKGGEQQAKKVNISATMHPSLSRAKSILDQYFERTILENQEVLTDPERLAKLLQIIPDETIRRELTDRWTNNPRRTATQKWQDILDELELTIRNKPKSKFRTDLANTARDIIFQYTYPRLDTNVSTGINHLLKSPFVVHPKTGRICVPIDPETCDDFDPLNTPTLVEIVKEMHEFDRNNKSTAAAIEKDAERKIPDYKKTSLRKHVEYFKKFLKGIEVENNEFRRVKREDEDKKMSF